MYLKTFEITEYTGRYPLNLPVLRERIEFTNNITILSGTNGCGKTTLLEIIAEVMDAIRIGDIHAPHKVGDDVLGRVRLSHVRNAKKKYYFSAENFIHYIAWIEKEKSEAQAEIRDIDAACARGEIPASRAIDMKIPHEETLYALSGLYANVLSRESHGEGFMDFFKSRLLAPGLYLIDEPESALTYENQFYLSAMIMESTMRDSQFIIATHSPIIAAIPNADIIEYTDEGLQHTSYDKLQDVKFLEMFMRRRELMFKGLEE